MSERMFSYENLSRPIEHRPKINRPRTRVPEYNPPVGMEQLTNLVSNLARDIKVIRQAQDLDGATAWAQKQQKRFDKPFNAKREDLNGDQIPEITVRGPDGNLVLVNGYTTTPSSWPETFLYGTALPYQQRKTMRKQGEYVPTKNEWVKSELNQVRYDPNNPFQINKALLNQRRFDEFGGIDNLKQRGYAFQDYSTAKPRTPYALFRDMFFKPFMGGLKTAIIKLKGEDDGPAYYQNNFVNNGQYRKLLTTAYKYFVANGVVNSLASAEDAPKIIDDPIAFKRIKAKKEFKAAAEAAVSRLVQAYINMYDKAGYERTELFAALINGIGSSLPQELQGKFDLNLQRTVYEQIVTHIHHQYFADREAQEQMAAAGGAVPVAVPVEQNPNALDQYLEGVDNEAYQGADEDRE